MDVPLVLQLDDFMRRVSSVTKTISTLEVVVMALYEKER